MYEKGGLQYEFRDFKNSKQKIEGSNKVLLLEHSLKAHKLKMTYERTDTKTKPQIPSDLKVKKIAARYTYSFSRQWDLSSGYICINDNLTDTDGGKIYSLRTQYAPREAFRFALSGYFGDYKIMKTSQIDAKLIYRYAFGSIKNQSTVIAKQINIHECQAGSICSNAQKSYFTPGFKQRLMYGGNYAMIGAFFGKRVFAVMEDGFKVQHHAMEFNKTMMAAIGKKFKGWNLMLAYVYQEAEELPIHNEGVQVRNTIISLGYRF
jgi:hypothetical protein